MSFQWQTDEERDNWEPASQPASPPKRRRWVFYLVAVIAAAATGGLLYRQAEQRIETTSAQVETDVLATHDLIQQAAETGDAELFRAYLSGRNPEWTDAQEALVEKGLYYDRSFLGLHPEVSARRARVTLNPDLTSAEVVLHRPYTFAIGPDTTGTIMLRETAVYRRGQQRWLLAPPAYDFWGDWETTNIGDLLTLTYREREAEIAGRLAADLEAEIREMCRSMAGINCPRTMHVYVRLGNDPAGLLAATRPENMLTSGFNVDLPTPTLVGFPVTETGYRALQRGYAAQVVSAVLTRLVGYDCCQHAPFYQALVDRWLAELDLKPWPLDAERYEALLDYADPRTVTRSWSRNRFTGLDDRDWDELYALADFLIADAPLGAPLAASRDPYAEWLDEHDYSFEALRRQWLSFIYSRSTSGETGSPIPLPEARLQFSCTNRDGHAYLLTYDPRQDVWSTTDGIPNESSFTRDMSVIPLSAAGFTVLQEGRVTSPAGTSTTTVTLLKDNEPLFRFRGGEAGGEYPFPFYFFGADPNGRYLALGAVTDLAEPPTPLLLDVARCTAGTCEAIPLPGYPAWSPDGKWMLMRELPRAGPAGATSRIYLSGAAGDDPVEIDRGVSEFWIDAAHFGIISHTVYDPVAAFALNIGGASAGDAPAGAPQTVLTSDDLLTVIARNANGESVEWGEIDADAIAAEGLTAGQVLASPDDPTRLILQAGSGAAWWTGPSFTFAIRLTSDFRNVEEVTLLAWGANLADVKLAPDGCCISLSQYGEVERLFIINLESGEQRTLDSIGYQSAWSPDSHWLAQRGQDRVTLVARDYDYRRIAFGDLQSCLSLTWREK